MATYGQIANIAGLSRNARQVGTALKGLPEDSDIPWHRVVNAQGKISDRGDGIFANLQRQMLESEGIEFNGNNKLNLTAHQWREGVAPTKTTERNDGSHETHSRNDLSVPAGLESMSSNPEDQRPLQDE